MSIVPCFIGSLQNIRVIMSRWIEHFGMLSLSALVYRVPPSFGSLDFMHLLQQRSSNIMYSVPLLNGSLFTFDVFITYSLVGITSVSSWMSPKCSVFTLIVFSSMIKKVLVVYFNDSKNSLTVPFFSASRY